MTQPRRSQAERSDQTQDALLRAAVDVIARRGYAEATLQEIADAAGVSKGAVHYHFRAKHELVGPVLARCIARVRAVAAEAWARDALPAERLRATLRALWDVLRAAGPEVRALQDLLARGLHDDHVHATAVELVATAERDLGAELARGVAALGLRPRIAPALMPRMLLALLGGMAQHERYGPAAPEAEVLAALETAAFALLAV